jgi:parallel beta-helix repeat protein
MNNCTMTLNSAGQYGGAIRNKGTLSAKNCTFSGNWGQFKGGGIDNEGTATVQNCTFYGNETTVFTEYPYGGGGIIAEVSANLTVESCTFSSNAAGGIFTVSTNQILIRNTILAGNFDTNSGHVTQDVAGTFSSQGFNLIGKTNGSSGWVASDLTGSIASPLDPLLGPLQYNGGPTPTMAPLPGSPAIDQGNSGGLTTDQRGAARPSDNPAIPNANGGDGTDIGAVEVQGPVITSQPLSVCTGPGSNVTFTVAASGETALFYTWWKVDTAFHVLTTGPNASYTVTNVQATNSGRYYVEVSDDYGFDVLSDYAFLTLGFNLVLNTNGSGTVSKSPDLPQYCSNATVQVTATPAPGWTFDHWSGAVTGTGNPVGVAMTSDKSITANFVQLPTLTVSVSGSGSVLKTPDQPYYALGTPVSLTAVPGVSWAFAGWSGDTNGTANPVTVVMTGNKSVTATFVPVCTPAPSGLVGWWPGAGNANDIFGTNNGALVNGATFAPGKVGQAFSLHESNSAVYIPNSPDLLLASQVTVEAWVRPNAVTNTQQIITLGDSIGAGFVLSVSTNGRLRLEIATDTFAYDFVESSDFIVSPGNWSHVAAVFNAGTMNLFANGSGVATKIGSISSVFSASPPAAAIGGAPFSGHDTFSGLIDELGIYNRGLSTLEIQRIAYAGGLGKCLAPLYITAITRTAGSVDLTWQGQKGMGYRMQYKTNLNSASWADLAPDVTATNGVATGTDGTVGDAAQRFYRVMLLQ